MKKICASIALLFATAFVFAQVNDAALTEIIEGEKAAWLRRQSALDRGVLQLANNRSDIHYTRFHFWVDPAVRYIRGAVMTVFEPTETVASLDFDFSAALTMDSILWHREKLQFSQSGDILTVHMHHPLPALLSDSLTFFYQGVPSSSGFGSFETNTHNNGTPVMWTLSEPYGASEWMPCKQALNDKIDSIDVFITHPDSYHAASNGLLQSETTADGLTTAHWKHRYPIATYLVAIAVTDYKIFSVDVSHPSGNTKIINYVYPESEADARQSMSYLRQQIQLYNDLFGLYPFQREKYGLAQFGWGGGMEHQTMSFMGGFGFELVAHETAHQWFGDKVTCGSWQDIWLNEGFATYLSGLCYEHLLPQYWLQFKQQRIQGATAQPGGSVWVNDTSSVDRIFSGRLSYSKGAMVLNMLRWVCGDSTFFAGLRSYVADPDLAYSYAKTSQLQAHLEAASGKSLTGFFADWYKGQGYPSYKIIWSQDANQRLSFKVSQKQSHPSVSYFELPLPLRLRGAQGQVKNIVLNHTTEGQTFQEIADFQVNTVEFDPDAWLISRDNTVERVTVGTQDLSLVGYRLQVSPNPAQGGVLQLAVEAPAPTQLQLTFSDATGKIVWSKPVQLGAGANRFSFDVADLPAGAYSLRMENELGQHSALVMLK